MMGVVTAFDEYRVMTTCEVHLLLLTGFLVAEQGEEE
jgi:hypothetical protein